MPALGSGNTGVRPTSPSGPSNLTKMSSGARPTNALAPNAFSTLGLNQPKQPNYLSPSAPAVHPAYSGGGAGTSYGGQPLSATGTGVIAEQAQPAPAPQPLGFDQYSADPGMAMQDAGYKTGVGAADAEYQNLIDQLTRQNANYMTDQGSSLRNMGFNQQTQQFDPTDMLGAYGQSVNNQQNDFSGRGMMDSTFYRQANDNLNGRFNDQKANIDAAGLAQKNDFNAGKTNAGVSQQSAHNQALAEAYTRYLSGYGATA